MADLSDPRRNSVIVVDDDADIRGLIVDQLRQENYDLLSASNLAELRQALRDQPVDLIVLDLNLPDGDGLSLCRELRAEGSGIQIIMVTARGSAIDRVLGLELGADDYLTKPFDTDELLARVRVALRNRMTRDGGSTKVVAGDLTIDLVAHIVTKGGVEVHLTPKEYGVLEQLARFPGRVITHKQIMDHVWPNEHAHHVEYLRVLVRGLRQKLEADPQRPQIISNELGIGYRLKQGAD